jgi:hypothetical protein
MKGNVEKAQVDVSRRLKDTAFALKVYTIWAIMTFLVIGLFGIYPQVGILVKNIQIRKEMQEVNNSLRNKIDSLNQETLKIENNVEGIQALDKTMPADYEIQNYIVDFSFAVSKAGYNLTGLQTGGITDSDQAVAVSADLEGNGSIGELIKSIESLNRAAQVKSVSFVEKNTSTKTGVKKVMCFLDIYVLK